LRGGTAQRFYPKPFFYQALYDMRTKKACAPGDENSSATTQGGNRRYSKLASAIITTCHDCFPIYEMASCPLLDQLL
jgi:hypothetical protein